MKKFLGLLAASTTAVTGAHAGSFEEPAVEAVEVVEDDNSSAGWLIPLIAIAAVVLIASGGSDDKKEDTEDLVVDDGPPAMKSDIRLKRNIQCVGTAENGLPLYRWQYLWSNRVYEGVMAQDVLKTMPQAVVRQWHGFYAVKYGMLGLQMKEVTA